MTPKDTYIEKTLKEFDKLVIMPDNDEQVKNSLYGGDYYPESPRELSEFKIRDFLESVLQNQIKEIAEKKKLEIEKCNNYIKQLETLLKDYSGDNQ
jgi:hypothetical protein